MEKKMQMVLFLSLVFPFLSLGQDTLVIDQNKQQTVRANQHQLNQIFRFSGRFFQDVYGNKTDSVGLVFDKGGRMLFGGKLLLRKQSNNQVFEDSWHDSPVVHVRNKTDLYFSGYWQGDNNYSKPILNILDSSRFVLGKAARLKLVFPAYGNFTRQLWVRSDGSGVFEVEEGFVADRSAGGTLSDGTGCFRLKDCTFRSHHQASLPVYFRPEKTNPGISKINSHLVFEKGKLGRWEVQTNKQNFVGGLWMYNNTEIYTGKHLEISGLYTHWSDYTNFGGLIFAQAQVSLIKTGSDTLTLSGHTCTPKGSRIQVKAGVFQLNVNPWYAAADTIKGLSKSLLLNGRNLELELDSAAELLINTPIVHLKTLKLNGKTKITLLQKAKIICDQAVGTLHVSVPFSVQDFQIETDDGILPEIKCFVRSKR